MDSPEGTASQYNVITNVLPHPRDVGRSRNAKDTVFVSHVTLKGAFGGSQADVDFVSLEFVNTWRAAHGSHDHSA